MRRLKSFAITAAILAIPLTSYGWTKTYGGEKEESYVCLQLASDGGYVVVASTLSFGVGDWDVWLLKTDSYGDTLWSRTYGGEFRDRATFVQETSDGGYIIVGSADSADYDDHIGTYPFSLKTDSEGNIIWRKTYGIGYEGGGAGCIQQTTDEGYIILAVTSAYPVMYSAIWLIKTDSLGDTLWTRIYGEYSDAGYFVKQTSDGGYIIVGETDYYTEEDGDDDLWLLKTDPNGDTLWTRSYGRSGIGYDEGGSCVEVAPDGGYIVVGVRESSWFEGMDIWLLRTDSIGDTLWTRTYGAPGYASDGGRWIQETDDGNYIVVGVKGEVDIPGDLWLLKINPQGDTLWTYSYGGEGSDIGICVHQTFEGGYIIGGTTGSFGAGSSDIWLLKTNEYGDTVWYEGSPREILNPQEGDTIAYMIPTAWFKNTGTYPIQDFYCHCEISSNQFHTPDYHVEYLISYPVDPGDSILVKFSPWVCDDSASYTALFYTSKEQELIWQTREKSVTFYGEPFSGVVEDQPLSPHWEIVTSCGHEIVLIYCNFPGGLHCDIFDVSGRKVDELKSVDASGTITWGDTAPTGIYFIRISPGARSAMRKVILLR